MNSQWVDVTSELAAKSQTYAEPGTSFVLVVLRNRGRYFFREFYKGEPVLTPMLCLAKPFLDSEHLAAFQRTLPADLKSVVARVPFKQSPIVSQCVEIVPVTRSVTKAIRPAIQSIKARPIQSRAAYRPATRTARQPDEFSALCDVATAEVVELGISTRNRESRSQFNVTFSFKGLLLVGTLAVLGTFVLYGILQSIAQVSQHVAAH
jgi:hypothetical protein